MKRQDSIVMGNRLSTHCRFMKGQRLLIDKYSSSGDPLSLHIQNILYDVLMSMRNKEKK